MGVTKKDLADGAAALNLSAQLVVETVKVITDNMLQSDGGELAGSDQEILDVVLAADKLGYLSSKFVEAAQFLVTSYAIGTKRGLGGDEKKVAELKALLDRELDTLQARLTTVSTGRAD